MASVYRIVPLALNGAGWRALIAPRPPSWPTTLRLRWIGEAVNALLPAAQVGGDFARARLLTAGGVPGAEATAAMVADVTVGAVTQVVFTFLGAAALIVYARPGAALRMHLGWLALVIGVGLATAALLLVVARVGVGRLLTALPLHLSGRLAARLSAGSATIDRALGSVRRRPRALLASSGWHIAAWLAQVVETWMVLKLLGRPVSWPAALAIESLAASARGAAFVVPGGIGVQEGALVAVGAAFGVATPTALALGIIKRGRELVVGAPAIVAWAIAERHAIARFWRRRHMIERRRIERQVTSPSLAIAQRPPRLRVGVLVDLHWSPNAGGHVKTWERLAAAAAAAQAQADADDRIDLTMHFLGEQKATHPLGPHVRYQIHRPLFSTARLPFLSQIPDHTDLAPHNPLLTSRLRGYDVIHTTDGTFAAARTAARVSRWHGVPLTNSVHTTTPYYTRVFTAATVAAAGGEPAVAPAARSLRGGPRRRGAHAADARRAPPPLRVRPRVADRRSRAAGLAARRRAGRPAAARDRARALRPRAARPGLAGGHVRDPRGAPGGDLRGAARSDQERAGARGGGARADRAGAGPSPPVRGQGARSRGGHGAARRPRASCPGVLDPDHAGPRLRVGGCRARSRR